MSGFENNRVVKHTGARYPIIQAPMAWVARARLVSAVSGAGAFGLLETSSADLDAARREYDLIKQATNRPFGINLAIKFLRGDDEKERAILDWAMDGRVKFVTTSAGDPGRYIRRLKDAGLIVYHTVPSLEGALKAEDAGVDGLIVEGGESAGVRAPNTVHSFVLLQAVRERVALPIVAAGGIADGRGMAAAFALGADAVTMGTRFVASTESPVHRNYKDAIVAATPSGTEAIRIGGGATARVLKLPLQPEGAAPGEKSRNLVADLYIGGRTDIAAGSAGESAGLIHEIKSAREIVDEMVAGFWREIDRLAALRTEAALFAK